MSTTERKCYWMTTAKPGDVMSLGLVTIRVKQGECGRIQLQFEIPSSVKIIKTRENKRVV